MSAGWMLGFIEVAFCVVLFVPDGSGTTVPQEICSTTFAGSLTSVTMHISSLNWSTWSRSRTRTTATSGRTRSTLSTFAILLCALLAQTCLVRKRSRPVKRLQTRPRAHTVLCLDPFIVHEPKPMSSSARVRFTDAPMHTNTPVVVRDVANKHSR